STSSSSPGLERRSTRPSASTGCTPRSSDTSTGTVSAVTDLTLAAWALVEVGVRVREGVQGKGRADRDRGTRVLIALTLGAAIVAALGARSVAPELRMPA